MALHAQSECYIIKDADSKNYCLATAKHDKSYCYSIKDADRKTFCLAQVGKERTRCYSIKSSDLKNHCLASLTKGRRKRNDSVPPNPPNAARLLVPTAFPLRSIAAGELYGSDTNQAKATTQWEQNNCWD